MGFSRLALSNHANKGRSDSPVAAERSTPHWLLGLQRSAGNAAVSRLIASAAASPARGPDGSGDHSVDLGQLGPGLHSARQTPAKTVPASLRRLAAHATGGDASSVRVHDDPTAWALNGAAGTAALTSGQDVFFRQGAFSTSTDRATGLIEHELAHVFEQHNSRFSRPQAATIDESRVRVKAERDYAKAAQTLELKLGPHLSRMPETHQIADDMLARLRRIVDAWAEATKVGKTKAYGEEFNFPTGTKYYGSFMLTAKEVKKVFEKPGQPLRKKLNLVYYATRNGNLATYLELAANELRLAHDKGKTTSSQTSRVQNSFGQKDVTLKGGFAKASGLQDRWAANNPLMLPGKKTSEEEVQADLAEHLRNPGKSGPVLGGFASASRPEAMNKALSKDKRYDTYKGLTLKETNTLLRADVPDITTAEMRLLYERSGQRQPVWISASDKAKFKSKGAERIQWEQGGQNIEVAANSETRRIAETTMSRLEGGISGSTDLMFHAGKHLGFTGAADLKRLRLALVAWMLSNRDHSFFEIMKVAADYGPPFNIDPNNLGSEYETQDNFSPLTGQQVANFSLLMPGHHMPSYYLGVVHKGTVDAGVAKGTTGDTYVGDLRTAGLVLDDTWKADPKSKDLAQWLELKSAVGGLSMQAAQTEGALKQNRVAVQALQKDPAWHHVNKPAVDAHADANLRALIAHSHGAAAVVSDGDLTNIGVPPALLTGLEEYKRYDIMRLRRAVDAGAKGLKGPTSNAHEAGVAKLCNSPAYAAVKHWVGGATAFLFLQSMLAAKLGNVRSTAGEKAAAVDGPLLVNFLNAHPGVNAQKAHLVSLGLPRSVADHVETRLRDGIDSSDRTPGVIFFRLEQLRTAVTAAGLVAGQPPTSTANKAARKTIRRSEAYRNVSSYVGAAATEACLTAFVIANIGARATTAGEDENLFRNTGQIDILTAAGIPRDLIEGNYRLRQPFENLRRAAVDAGFNTAQPPTHVANTTAWTKLTTGKAFTDLLVHLDNNQATAYAAALVKSQVGPAVLGPSQKMLAKATEQRMANEDKLRLGKTAVMDTTTLQTPTMHGEAPDPLQTAAREERYWATAAADTDLTINIGAGAKSPTIKAQLTLWKTHLRNTPGDLATEINTACTRWVASQPDPKPTVKDAKDMFFPDTDSTAEQIDNLMTMIPGPELLDHVSPEVKAAVQAIQALSPRERGAIYQYTNKLHDQLGYATQSFSMATDFTAHDLSTTTDKLRAVPFMLPILQALNSALERLPAYNASPVFSGRKSSANSLADSLTAKSDQDRLNFAATNFKVGSVLSYSYPLSTAKDVDASFLSKPGYDVALYIQQPLKTGRDIEYLSNKVNEKEVLFPQGVRFSIVAVNPQPPAGIPVDANTQDKLWVTLKEI